MDYWANKEQSKALASMHVAVMDDRFGDETEISVGRSRVITKSQVYEDDSSATILMDPNPVIQIVNETTVGQIFKDCNDLGLVTTNENEYFCMMSQLSPDKQVIALNFASFRNPGGKFIEGSMAQEESLCHSSNLYNILASRHIRDIYYSNNAYHTNDLMYDDFILYSPAVTFIDRDTNRMCPCNIMTVAAPNYRAATKYRGVPDYKLVSALESRIDLITKAINGIAPDRVILGAFGCGVFGWDPTIVANVFKKAISSNIHHEMVITFAIPGGRNLDAFRNVFS